MAMNNGSSIPLIGKQGLEEGKLVWTRCSPGGGGDVVDGKSRQIPLCQRATSSSVSDGCHKLALYLVIHFYGSIRTL